MSEVFSKEKFIKELVDELHEVRTKWREIGTQLEIPQETLKSIGRQNDDSGLAFTEMIDEWIKGMKDREPTWVDIVRVLESRSVDERRLARNLRQRRTTDSEDDFTVPDDTIPGEDDSECQLIRQIIFQNYKCEKVPPAVEEGIRRLHQHFNSLRIKVFRHVEGLQEAQKISVNDFRVFVCNPEHLLVRHDHRGLLRAKSTSDICTIVSQKRYLNWQHYILLEEIINEYGDPNLKQDLESYCKEIELFEEATGLNDVRNIIFTPLGPNSHLMKVPIPEEVENPTMGTVRKINNELKRINGFPSPLHLIGKNSPLGIYFIMPQLPAPMFMKDMSVSAIESDELDLIVIQLSKKCVLQLLNIEPNPTLEVSPGPPPFVDTIASRELMFEDLPMDYPYDVYETESEYEILSVEEVSPVKKKKLQPKRKRRKSKGKKSTKPNFNVLAPFGGYIT